MTFTGVNLPKHLFRIQVFIAAQITKGTVWAGGLERLKLQDLCDNEIFNLPISIYQPDFLPEG